MGAMDIPNPFDINGPRYEKLDYRILGRKPNVFMDIQHRFLCNTLPSACSYLDDIAKGSEGANSQRILVCQDIINRACGKPVIRQQSESINLTLTADEYLKLRRSCALELKEFEANLLTPPIEVGEVVLHVVQLDSPQVEPDVSGVSAVRLPSPQDGVSEAEGSLEANSHSTLADADETDAMETYTDAMETYNLMELP